MVSLHVLTHLSCACYLGNEITVMTKGNSFGAQDWPGTWPARPTLDTMHPIHVINISIATMTMQGLT